MQNCVVIGRICYEQDHDKVLLNFEELFVRRAPSINFHPKQRMVYNYDMLKFIWTFLYLQSIFLYYIRATAVFVNDENTLFREKKVSAAINILLFQMWAEYYSDAIMRLMASQITGVPIVCSTVCLGAVQRKHQSTASLAFVREIHQGDWWIPLTKAKWRGKGFDLMTFS